MHSVKIMKFAFILGLFTSPAAHATPVIYKGGVMLSTMLHADYSSLHAAYSFSSRYALGVTYEEFREDGEGDRYYYLQNNFLLKRFFQDSSQGNIYVKLGAGHRQLDDNVAYYGGLQGDWETRTFYSAVSSDMLATKDNVHELMTSLSVGVSPYEARYDEMQAWLLMQVEHRINTDTPFSFTPMLRVFHKSAKFEIGSDLDGHWKMHFMVHL